MAYRAERTREILAPAPRRRVEAYRESATWRTLCGMKTLRFATFIVSVAAASSIGTLFAQKQVQKSTVYAWSPADIKPNDWGAVRQVMRAATPTLDELEIHISTLDPGKSP